VAVNLVDPLMLAKLAVMVELPCASVLASPPLFTVAVDVEDDVQLAVLVRFWVLPLL